MSLNENKPTYGTVEAAGATKDSRRGVVVGLVRPRARKSSVFGQSGSPFGQGGFNGGKPLMGPGFPFGGESTGVGTGPSRSQFGPQGIPGMSFPGMPDSAETTPDVGGVATHGY